MVGIYKITSPVGKIYIGQSRNVRARLNCHKSRAKLGLHKSKLYSSINKYGFENHTIEIVHELPTDVSAETLSIYERLYIDLYLGVQKETLNIAPVIDSLPGIVRSNETREKLRQGKLKNPTGFKKGYTPWNKGLKTKGVYKKVGRKLSDEEKKHIASFHIGRKHTPESIQKMKDNHHRYWLGKKRSK